MNASIDAEGATLPLVEIVELKWLLAHRGVRLHVERLQHDAAYAASLLALAGASADPALRGAAERLRRRLAGAG